ncbi:transposase [Phenylobacterium sp.]|uniref:transposase n=1 Tax=Phenylobacterium sp. TaxID=1871053 RepID=UPI00273536F2|nr:transposase [Phenylobacterium sp.]MDP3595106.1 transposase [Phenylobacterium sp.]
MRKKIEFARKHRNTDWRRIVFTDESWLCCNERTGKIHWARTRAEVLAMEKKARWNVPSIMIWGCIGYNYKSELIVFPSKQSVDGEMKQFRLDSFAYVRRCLSTVAPSLAKTTRLFQQDGARSHAAKHTLQYLKRKGVALLEPWPPYSPELNAIERIWKEMNVRVGARCPMTMDELMVAAKEAWAELPQSVINAHCKHFREQVRRL